MTRQPSTRHGTAITLGAAVFTLAMLGFFLHAATAGRHRVTYRCERADGQVVDLQLRRDAVVYTGLGFTVVPDAGPPWVAEFCEVRP